MITFTLNKSVSGNYEFLLKRLDTLNPNTRWQVSVIEYKSKRSKIQNDRYWALLTALGNYLGYTKDEMHDLCRQKFLSENIEINGEMFKRLKSTPKTNTGEFAEYSNMCEMWAGSLGFTFNYRYN